MEKPSEQRWLFRVQNVGQFHEVAKYEKISPKKSINIKSFRPKLRIHLFIIRRDTAKKKSLIQKLTAKK